jgi:DNA-binding transcriptional LysR family regulator
VPGINLINERHYLMNFDLITLRLFTAVVDEASFAKAARRHHITSAAISKRIAELEDRLGVRLLDRRAGGICPTPPGAALATTARKVLDDLDAVGVTLSEFLEGQRGGVRIFSGPSGIVGSLPDHLTAFAAEHPNITLEIKEQSSADAVQAVRDGVADLAIYAPHIVTSGLDSYGYQLVQLVLLVARGHPLANRRSISFADAARHEFIGLSPDSALGQLLQRVMRETGVRVRKRFEVTGQEPVRRLVQAGVGVGILPITGVLPYAEAMGLHCIRLSDKWATYQLRICTQPYRVLSLPARKVLDHLVHDAVERRASR